MPLGPSDAARRARRSMPQGSGVVVVYISKGLGVVRCQPELEAATEPLPNFGCPHDRSFILIGVVTSGQPLVWPDWPRRHQELAATWGGVLVDVLVVSPTHWRSLLVPLAGQPASLGGLEPRTATPAR